MAARLPPPPGPYPRYPVQRQRRTGYLALIGTLCLISWLLGAISGVGLSLLVSGEESSAEPDEKAGPATTLAAPTAPAPDTPATSPTGAAPIADVYTFGQRHSRPASLLGAAWTISIDEVRQIDNCTAIIGTAKLDSLDSDELTSNPFDFPTPRIVVGGRELTGDEAGQDFSCVTSPTLEREGLLWNLNVSLAPGGEVRWYHLFYNPGGTYDLVAIERTRYAPG